jgi:hypothetical protein
MATVLDDANTTMLRRVLDDVLTDPQFTTQTAVSAFQVAEHIWRQAAMGERDFDRIRYSALVMVNSSTNTLDPAARQSVAALPNCHRDS